MSQSHVKQTYSFRLDEAVAARFKQFVLEKYGKLYEVLGEELQNAIVHWLDEHGLDAHTTAHKINPGIPRAQAKIDAVIQFMRGQGHTNQFVSSTWEKACMHVVGSDARTIMKYLKLAQQLGKVKHHAGAVWEIV